MLFELNEQEVEVMAKKGKDVEVEDCFSDNDNVSASNDNTFNDEVEIEDIITEEYLVFSANVFEEAEEILKEKENVVKEKELVRTKYDSKKFNKWL